MVIINETSQNYFSNTKKSNLNPKAPQFHPTTLTKNYPYLSPPSFKVIYPTQPKVINIIYGHIIYPTKSIYHTNNDLPIPPIIKSKPILPKSSPTHHKARKPIKTGQRFWVKKDLIDSDPFVVSSYPFGDSTTLMIRNIPVRYCRKELIELLDDHCRIENERISSTNEVVSAFDFLYLPIDFKRKGNLGYAFVNMTTWQGASRLYNSWNGNKWKNCPYNTKKICQIHRAKFQGKLELRRHFEQSVFWCETNEYLPVEFSPPRNGINSNQTYLTTIGTRVW